MIIRLLEPAAKNWLLAAAELRDPEGWSRFVPCHTQDSDRYNFESAVRQTASAKCQLIQCKDLQAPGVCVFEYDWSVDEEALLEHAMTVAELLGIELLIGAEPEPTGSRSAA